MKYFKYWILWHKFMYNFNKMATVRKRTHILWLSVAYIDESHLKNSNMMAFFPHLSRYIEHLSRLRYELCSQWHNINGNVSYQKLCGSVYKSWNVPSWHISIANVSVSLNSSYKLLKLRFIKPKYNRQICIASQIENISSE